MYLPLEHMISLLQIDTWVLVRINFVICFLVNDLNSAFILQTSKDNKHTSKKYNTQKCFIFHISKIPL